jgi:hypothetical protein
MAQKKVKKEQIIEVKLVTFEDDTQQVEIFPKEITDFEIIGMAEILRVNTVGNMLNRESK